MQRLSALLLVSAIGVSTAMPQTFFSVNAGTDGFNFNVTNVPPVFPAVVVAPPPPRHHMPVCVPLRPGVEYYPVVSPKRYHKAVKRYRKALRRSSPAMGIYLPGGVVVGTAPGYYYDDDDDDYEDWLEDQYKHHKKMYKKYKKAHKHHKHHKHHHDWDDDD